MGFSFETNASEFELSCDEKLRILSKQMDIRTRICGIQNQNPAKRKTCIDKVQKNLIHDCDSLKKNREISYTKQNGFLVLSIGESR